MQKTKIEWCDYTINPVKGLCPMACPYCYARRMYRRFKWNPEIRFENPPIKMPPDGSKIFVGSTMELFGSWVKPRWLEWLFGSMRQHPKHIFITLTKLPQNLIQWSPFPNNCWVGATATNDVDLRIAIDRLKHIEATIKFISLEPLLYWDLEWDTLAYWLSYIHWIIIGAQTPYSIKTAPRKEWIDRIIDACDEVGIPVFLKNNLRPVLKHIYGDTLPMRQEYPVVKL